MKFFFPSPFSSSFPFFLPPSFSRDSRLVVSLGNAVLKISFSLSPLPSRRPPLSCCKFLLHTGYWIIWKGNGEKENFWPNGTCKRKKGRMEGRRKEERKTGRESGRKKRRAKNFSRVWKIRGRPVIPTRRYENPGFEFRIRHVTML